MSDTVTDLEQQLAAARQAEQQQAEVETIAASLRERQYREEWLASYDREGLRREAEEADAALVQALEDTPAFAAFANARAAKFRLYRAAQISHNHKSWLAIQDGRTPPHDPMTVPPPDLTPNALTSAIDRMVATRIAEWQEQQDDNFAAAVYGDGLTPEQILAAEANAEEVRRRDAARVTTVGGTDVTDMTDQQRAEHGLPAGSPRTAAERAYR